jgi:hypothetical protein
MRWIIGLVIVFAMIAWAGITEDKAETGAVSFCDSIAEGSSFAEIATRAKSIGSDSLRIIRKDSLTVGFTGMTPLSRHFCEISGANGIVKEKNYYYLD